MARSLRTSHSPKSTSPIEQVATVRPYWSNEMGMQFNDRLANKSVEIVRRLGPALILETILTSAMRTAFWSVDTP
jgi:hypothetical protein